MMQLKLVNKQKETKYGFHENHGRDGIVNG